MDKNAPEIDQPDSFDWGFIVYLLFVVGALTAPHLVGAVYGLYWAAAAGAGVVILWMATMPVTCMEGGLISSMIAMAILGNGAVLIFAVLARLIRLFFS